MAWEASAWPRMRLPLDNVCLPLSPFFHSLLCQCFCSPATFVALICPSLCLSPFTSLTAHPFLSVLSMSSWCHGREGKTMMERGGLAGGIRQECNTLSCLTLFLYKSCSRFLNLRLKLSVQSKRHGCSWWRQLLKICVPHGGLQCFFTFLVFLFCSRAGGNIYRGPRISATAKDLEIINIFKWDNLNHPVQANT